jgi:cytochrome c-L
MLRQRKNPFIILLVLASSTVSSLQTAAKADVGLRHVVTGALLDLSGALPEDRDTEGMKQFLKTGANPYIDQPDQLSKGRELFAMNCSGCHGQFGQGGMGPSLNNGRWIYPQNSKDSGLFATIFGGARAPMAAKADVLTLDETLRVMAWIRKLYTGPAERTAMAGSHGCMMHAGMTHAGMTHSGMHGGGASGEHSGHAGNCDGSGHSGEPATAADEGDWGSAEAFGDAEGCNP